MQESLFELNSDLYLLGSGIKSFTQLTLETQYILKHCKELYYLHELPSLERFLKNIHPNPVNLLTRFYVEGRKRLDIYNNCADYIVERAVKVSPIAFLLHGHPLVFSALTVITMRKAESNNVKVEMYPGVSFLDTLFADLRVDIGECGTQIVVAYALLNGTTSVNPKMHTIIAQIAAPQSEKAERLVDHSSKSLAPLKELLLKCYPDDHGATVIESSVELGSEPFVQTVTIGSLDRLDFPIRYNYSLYIPSI